MAGVAPLFSTAPRIKLEVNGVAIAFAIGLNLNVSVDIQPVTVLGKFGPVSLEPTMYNVVTGTMQIIRLISKEDMETSTNILQAAANQPFLANDIAPLVRTSAEEAAEGTQETSSSVTDFSSNNPLVQNSIIRHMDPRSVLLSTTFDMELKMRVPDPTSPGVTEALDLDDNNDPAAGVMDVNSESGALISVPWMTVRQCRLTSRNINISVGQLVNEPVSFQGIFLTPKNSSGADMFFHDAGPSAN